MKYHTAITEEAQDELLIRMRRASHRHVDVKFVDLQILPVVRMRVNLTQAP